MLSGRPRRGDDDPTEKTIRIYGRVGSGPDDLLDGMIAIEIFEKMNLENLSTWMPIEDPREACSVKLQFVNSIYTSNDFQYI